MITSISIVVPTHNRVKKLVNLLKSFKNLKEQPNEIIVINDGSSNNTSRILNLWRRKRHEFVPIVCENPFPIGPGASRNIGIKLSNSDYIAFTDDDCIVDPNWIHSIRNSNYWINNSIAGIGGKVLPVKNGKISQYYTFHRILEPPVQLQYLVTANACYRRNLLIRVNGFDKTHIYPGGEDNGLSFKLAKLGYSFGFEENMIIKHNYRTTIQDFI